MIAEENLSHLPNPNISVSNSNILLNIRELMVQAVTSFKAYLDTDIYKKGKLNEDDYTQIYIEQAQILIREFDYPFNINGQYRDITNLSKGFSDFYFYPNEQGVSTASLFSVESKRLPSPERSREKEYVIGAKNNGGIERYKTEKHGKGLTRCGLLGFVEQKTSSYWLEEVNGWIKKIAEVNSDWRNDEVLSQKESTGDYSIFESVAHRRKYTLDLTHLWIIMS